MAKKTNDLSHTKWMCKYHIVFTPKYRRKIIYNQYNSSKFLLKKQESLKELNSWHRVLSGQIFLSQKKALKHTTMLVDFRKIWILNL